MIQLRDMQQECQPRHRTAKHDAACGVVQDLVIQQILGACSSVSVSYVFGSTEASDKGFRLEVTDPLKTAK